MISDSLLASARVLPASRAASVGRSPTAPVIPLSTVWHSCEAASMLASSPRPWKRGANSATCCSKRSRLPPPAVRPTTRKRPGFARTTSSAWVPMEPVEPRMTMSRGWVTQALCLDSPHPGANGPTNRDPARTHSASDAHRERDHTSDDLASHMPTAASISVVDEAFRARFRRTCLDFAASKAHHVCMTDLQRAAKDNLWMHFTRLSTYQGCDVPVIVRGEGAYIYDDHGNRYLDGLAG